MSDSHEIHQTLVQALQAPELWPQEGGNIELVETHISSVLLVGEFAYKIKKPLDLGFLDFSTLERRKLFCEEEIRLNGRLAPRIYLEVVAITGTPEQPVLGGGGEPFEYAVKMRRFADDGLLSNRPDSLTPELMDAIGRQVAAFHNQIAVCGTEESFGGPDAVLFPMQQNFDQIRGLLQDPAELAALDPLEAWTRQRHQELEALLSKRKSEGYIRECHGDMHLGNITLIEGEAVIFDGIEFNPSLRWIDLINEIAFLVMDLDARGRPDLGQRVLNRYLEETGDYGGLALLRFYQVYRAMVRAKVAAIRLGQPGLAEEEQAALLEEYHAYIALAEQYTQLCNTALIITHGVSGSGKSYSARSLVMGLPAIQIRSDVERKRLAGLASDERSGSDLGGGIYTDEFTQRTYQRLLELAEEILAACCSVVVDATFLKQPQRQPFAELAERLGIPFVILNMHNPEQVLRERVRTRQAAGCDPSEADEKVMEAQLASAEALTEEELECAVAVIPEQPFSVEDLKARIF
jgi:aminoglycoside phosphotransferase family enzyme